MKTSSGGPLVRAIVKHPWVTAALVAATLALGSAIAVVSGVVPIKASSGHWGITAWVLDFAKVRSVALHARWIEVPPLDDAALVMRGAGHYAIGCASCHGIPGGSVPPVMVAMTPHPPELPPQIARWTPAELFYIVKHGIKFTGMPAWPDEARDDEVWAMVAFLRRMPSLDAAAYRKLAVGETTETSIAPKVVRDVCQRCHGLDGLGREANAFPRLAGQRPDYLYHSLKAFASRSRRSGTMGAVAASLRDEDMRAAAEYFASLAPRPIDSASVADAAARGEIIARQGIPERDVPACVECHGPREGPRNPQYPDLGGQNVEYLRGQLRLLKERRRGGAGYENLMEKFVDRLRPDEIADVTWFYATAVPSRR